MTLNEVLGAPTRSATPISGGDINDAYKLILTDGRQVVMKANRSAGLSFFQAEADGLEAIHATGTIGTPKVIDVGKDQQHGAFLLLEWVEASPKPHDFWESFGRNLARMHQAPAFHFGWGKDNYIGANPQINTPHDNWITFYRDCRLAPQFRNAQHYFDPSTRKCITRLLDHLEDHLVEPAHPSLLHGDLWSGNFITGNDGQAWLIDPAVYVGHAEADLAMTELFGGFAPAFYSAYQEVNPLQPGYEQRRDMYNLYHLLNHLNLFGGGYLSSVLRVLNRYS